MKNRKPYILLAVLLALGLLLTACGRKSIEMKNYLRFEAKGFDTAGTASCKLDLEALVSEHLEEFGLQTADSPEGLALLLSLDRALDGALDRSSGLKNGDEIHFQWKSSDLSALEERYDLELKLEDAAFTVSGLEEARRFDPFAYLHVSFEGIGPEARAILEKDSGLPISGISFQADRLNNLDNGESITVRFGGDDCEERCFQKGLIPESTQKTYTVEGLASYLNKLEQLPPEANQKLDDHARETLRAKAADWKEPSDLWEVELLGNYLLTPKDPSILTFTHNTLYYIYRVTVRDRTEGAAEGDAFQYYYYSSYDNLVLLPDGSCSFDLGSIQIPTGGAMAGIEFGEYFLNGSQAYGGYRDLDSLFNKHITAKIDKYSYESTVETP